MSYNGNKVYRKPDEIVVADGGKITNDGTQAAAIADISTTLGDMTAAERTAFNSVLAALRGVGIIAT